MILPARLGWVSGSPTGGSCQYWQHLSGSGRKRPLSPMPS